MEGKTDSSDLCKSETVKVVVRCRPMSEKEKSSGYHSVVKLYPADGTVKLQHQKFSPEFFTFDAVYDCGSSTEIYDEVFRPLVDSVINGFNGTIFAYGQTGAGKTYTMEGIIGDPEHEGVIPNAFRHIFSHIAQSENTQFLVSASYLEIYEENVHDLLSPDPKRKLDVQERNDTGVYVKDLTVSVCKTVGDLEKVMIDGKRNRSIGTTNMNAHSSRSHAIFIISIESCESDTEGNQDVKIGKLNLVDLAGSEKQSETGAAGLTQKESIKINVSLSALGNVISALVDGKSTHVPYRDSKLTRLLQDSLGGNAKTIMIGCIGPASYNYEETLTTLRYANRAKNIKNKPVVNIDTKDAILLKYKEEISRLKAQLALKEARKKKESKVMESGVIEDVEEDSIENIKKMEHLLEEERVELLNEENLMSEETQKILQNIKAKEEELRLEDEAKEKIESQLRDVTTDSSMFLMFTNKSNSCWVDSALAVIAHSRAIKKIVDSIPSSKIYEVILAHNQATFVLNDPSNSSEYRINTAKDILGKIQASILQYLQPILKYNEGEPDSAFCALLNLIYENKVIKENLSIKWQWEKNCVNCGSTSKSSELVKPIITFSKVNTFEPHCPTSIFVCKCKTEQQMKLIYKELPSCLIFHFEKGAGNGSPPPLFFSIQDRKYFLTSIVTLEKSQDPSINHFITWIRDPLTNKWLECNDLNTDIIFFSSEQPQFVSNDIYMYIFESFDNKGKISNEVSTDSFPEQCFQNVEVIDLSDDAEIKDDKSDSSVLIAAESIQSIETSVAHLDLKDPVDLVSGMKNEPLVADEGSVKRKFSGKQLGENSVEESIDVKNNQNIIPPSKVPKVLAEPKNEVEEITDYEEGKLQIQMQKALLKKDYNRCVSTNESVNEEYMSDVHHASKSIVEKSTEKHKKMNKIQMKDSVDCTAPAKDYSKGRNQNSVPKPNVEGSAIHKHEKYRKEKNVAEKQNLKTSVHISSLENKKRMSEVEATDSMSCTSSAKNKNVTGKQRKIDIKLDEKLEEIVNNVVESTFASFLEQVLKHSNVHKK